MKKFIIMVLCFMFILPFAFASHFDSNDPSVVASYRFEQNCNDQSSYNNSCSEQGTIVYSSSKGGSGTGSYSLFLDGSSDYVNATEISAYNVTDFSISLWVNSDDLTIDATLFAQYDSDGNNRKWRLYSTGDGNVTLELSENGQGDAGSIKEVRTSLGVLGFGEWKHIVAIYDFSADDVSFYVDGTIDPSPIDVDVGPLDGLYNTSADLTIGASLDTNAGTNFFTGFVDEVNLFNRVLTGSEAIQIYTVGVLSEEAAEEEPEGTPDAPRDYINFSTLIIDEDFDYSTTYASNGWSFFSTNSVPNNPVPSVFTTLDGAFGNNDTFTGGNNPNGGIIYRSFNSQAIQPSEQLLIVFDMDIDKSNEESPAFTLYFGNESGVFAGTSSIKAKIFDTESGNDRIVMDFSTSPYQNATEPNCDISSFITKTGDADEDNITYNGEIAIMFDFANSKYYVYVDQIALTDCNGISMGSSNNPDYEINSLSIAVSVDDSTPETGTHTDTQIDNLQFGKGQFGILGVLTTAQPPIGDLATSVTTIWDDMGLESSESKTMVGVIIMVMLAIMMWGFSVSNGIHLSPIILVVIEFFAMIGLTYVGLLPRWLPYVVGLLAVAGVVLVIRSGNDNGF